MATWDVRRLLDYSKEYRYLLSAVRYKEGNLELELDLMKKKILDFYDQNPSSDLDRRFIEYVFDKGPISDSTSLTLDFMIDSVSQQIEGLAFLRRL